MLSARTLPPKHVVRSTRGRNAPASRPKDVVVVDKEHSLASFLREQYVLKYSVVCYHTKEVHPLGR